MTKTTTPKIYVADLAAYNAGKLRGVWIDAAQEPDQIKAEVQAMLAESLEPLADEHAIHDTDGFEGVFISEWANFEDVHQIALLIEEHGALGAELLNHWNNDVDEVRRLFEDGYYLGVVGEALPNTSKRSLKKPPRFRIISAAMSTTTAWPVTWS